MKKAYVKPCLLIEPFQLDTAVASCSSEDGIALGYSYETCTLYDDKGPYVDPVLFGNACTSCVEVEPGTKVCYNGPLGDMTFMNS